MPQYRLLQPHAAYDTVLEEGTLVGDGTPYPWPKEMISLAMEGTDDTSRKLVEERMNRHFNPKTNLTRNVNDPANEGAEEGTPKGSDSPYGYGNPAPVPEGMPRPVGDNPVRPNNAPPSADERTAAALDPKNKMTMEEAMQGTGPGPMSVPARSPLASAPVRGPTVQAIGQPITPPQLQRPSMEEQQKAEEAKTAPKPSVPQKK